MLPIILIVIVLFFCLTKKSIWLLCFFIFCFPYHNFICSVLELVVGTKGVFPIWRELILLFVLMKTKTYRYIPKHLSICVFFVYVLIFMFVFWGKYVQNLSYARLYISYFIWTIVVMHMRFNKRSLYKLIKTFVLSAFIICLGGFIQYFLVREQLHVLMGDYAFDQWGNYTFRVPNWTIMGYERMAGFICVPNTFGLCTAFSTYFLGAMWIGKKQYLNNISRFDLIIFYLTLVLSAVCMLLSFSRTGWAICVGALLTYTYKMHRNSMKVVKIIIGSFSVILISILIAYIFVPETLEIIFGSFNGEERSAATRQEMLMNSYGLIGYLMGNGIGGSDSSGDFFAESSFLNIMYELGLFGILLWMYILSRCYFESKNKHLYIFSALIPVSLFAILPQSNILQPPFVYYFHIFAGLALNKSIPILYKAQRLKNKTNLRERLENTNISKAL